MLNKYHSTTVHSILRLRMEENTSHTWRDTGKQGNVSRKLSQTSYRRERISKKLNIPHHKKMWML